MGVWVTADKYRVDVITPKYLLPVGQNFGKSEFFSDLLSACLTTVTDGHQFDVI